MHVFQICPTYVSQRESFIRWLVSKYIVKWRHSMRLVSYPTPPTCCHETNYLHIKY